MFSMSFSQLSGFRFVFNGFEWVLMVLSGCERLFYVFFVSGFLMVVNSFFADV